MERFRFMEWEIEVDAVGTRRAQAARERGDAESCGCVPCNNFAAARDMVYPTQFIELLDRLGVPKDRESRTGHCGRARSGLHYYLGWFHFVGSVVSGPYADRDGDGSVNLERISPSLEMGFMRRASQVPDSFSSAAVAELFFSANVPWVLGESLDVWRE